MVYTYKKMLSDIRLDLAKYVELYPGRSIKPPNMLKVLINSPGFYVVASYRVLYWLKMWHEKSGSYLVKFLLTGFHFIAYLYWAIAMKTQIKNWPKIGPGLYLSNKGGIIIGPKRMGAGCVIHHNVTIGINLVHEHPDIGSNVWIGPNSLIYGRVIKDGVIVQPESVVGKNIPTRVVVKGNPATIVRRNIDNSNLLSNYSPNLEYEPFV